MNSLEPSHLPQAFILVLFAVALSYFYNLRGCSKNTNPLTRKVFYSKI
ncbi:MAG: hypothetical protein ACO2PP_21730 [Thermocrinis sp.]